jgi:hypothetical protein
MSLTESRVRQIVTEELRHSRLIDDIKRGMDDMSEMERVEFLKQLTEWMKEGKGDLRQRRTLAAMEGKS